MTQSLRQKERKTNTAFTTKPGEDIGGMLEVNNSINNHKDESFTRIPNTVFDKIIPSLKVNEIKCFLYILRQTIGWNKKCDAISLSQFMCNLHISKPETVRKSLRSLEKRGFILSIHHPGKVTKFCLTLEASASKKRGDEKSVPQNKALICTSSSAEKTVSNICCIGNKLVINGKLVTVVSSQQNDISKKVDISVVDIQGIHYEFSMTQEKYESLVGVDHVQ